MVDQVFIAWKRFQRRPVSMQPYFGYRMIFLPLTFTERWLRPFDYAINGLRTFFVLATMRPRVVWLQLAPTPLLYVGVAYKWLLNWNAKIVIDCHNSAFREPFLSFPGIRWLMKHADLMLLHNENYYDEVASRCNVCMDRAVVLEDKAAIIKSGAGVTSGEPSPPKVSAPFFLMCCSFDVDEPIDTVFAAARLVPDIRLKITGDPRRALRHDLSNVPSNVELTGFVTVEALDKLIAETVGMVCLTTRNTTQLSVCSEAIGAGRPMILADTMTLRALFSKGGVFLDRLDPGSLAAAFRNVVERQEVLSREVSELRETRRQRWETQGAAVKQQLLGDSRLSHPKHVTS